MAKLTREQKIEIYNKRKSGNTIAHLSKEYGIRRERIEYLIRLIDMHGFDILRNNENRYYSPELKKEIIDKILVDHQSINSVSIEYGLSSNGLLHSWINSYKDNGCVIVERNKGRSPTMKKEIKPIDPKDKDAIMSSNQDCQRSKTKTAEETQILRHIRGTEFYGEKKMISNETIRKTSEIGMIDVLDAIKLVESNPTNIAITFEERINMADE